MPFDPTEFHTPTSSAEIPLCVPNIGGNEWTYVKECLDTGWVSSAGEYVVRFEREFAGRVGGGFAVATVNGTAALHVALVAAGVGPGDEVIVPALTFIAPANAVRYTGAYPAFVDVDPEYWQVNPTDVRVFLEEDCEPRDGGLHNRQTGRAVRAILPVDILGHPCDLDALRTLAEEFGLAMVEDATESLGALYRDRPLGQWSSLTCFSFNGNKVITTGGGGMVVTPDEALARRMRYLTTQAKDDAVEFVHRDVGFNYRLTNVQAAMGCAQLERLDDFVQRKRDIARRYREGLADLPGIVMMGEAPWARATFWLSTILVEGVRANIDSRGLLRALAAQGIETRPLWQPLHRSAAHTGSFARPCPVAERLNREALSLPSSTGLDPLVQGRVIESIRESVRKATRTVAI
jgi:perosamine synthetase